MITEFIKKWEANKHLIERQFAEKHPKDYKEIVKAVIEILDDKEDYSRTPNSEIIHEINDGDYQGTLIYLIPERTYQPSNYWYVKVGYGSCSGCDTLEAIKADNDGEWAAPPNKRQTKDYMTLALHIIQKLRKMEEEWV